MRATTPLRPVVRSSSSGVEVFDMSSSGKVWICTLLLSLTVLAGQGVIQPFPAQATPAPESLIKLEVVVNDRSGKPVSGLKQQDFTVMDDKLPQKTLSFEAVTGATADSGPVEVVLVADSVNISFMRVAYVRDQIKKFLRKDGGELGSKRRPGPELRQRRCRRDCKVRSRRKCLLRDYVCSPCR